MPHHEKQYETPFWLLCFIACLAIGLIFLLALYINNWSGVNSFDVIKTLVPSVLIIMVIFYFLPEMKRRLVSDRKVQVKIAGFELATESDVVSYTMAHTLVMSNLKENASRIGADGNDIKILNSKFELISLYREFENLEDKSKNDMKNMTARFGFVVRTTETNTEIKIPFGGLAGLNQVSPKAIKKEFLNDETAFKNHEINKEFKCELSHFLESSTTA